MLNNFKKIAISAMAISSVMSSASIFAKDNASMMAPSQSMQQKQSSTALSYLFVLSAAKGKITRQQQGYTLTLKQVDPHVLWFADRPVRQAGLIKLSDFMGQWQSSFAHTPPNAAKVHAGMQAVMKGNDEAATIELSAPVYHHHSLTFNVKPLSGTKLMKRQLNAVKLFIDNTKSFMPPHWRAEKVFSQR